jgi:arginyl-tRNA synthetase
MAVPPPNTNTNGTSSPNITWPRATPYAYECAAVFHPTYETCRVLHPDVPYDLQLARLHFYRAAKMFFGRVLDLMGMSAPEVM